MYVLRRTKDGKYVANPGSQKSYTSKIEYARQYPTREAADGDKCGNEYAVETRSLLQRCR